MTEMKKYVFYIDNYIKQKIKNVTLIERYSTFYYLIHELRYFIIVFREKKIKFRQPENITAGLTEPKIRFY